MGARAFFDGLSLSNDKLTGTALLSPQTFGYPGATPTVSANGNSDGIVRVVEPSKAVLHADNAADVARAIQQQ
jgi:hypothetical protein